MALLTVVTAEQFFTVPVTSFFQYTSEFSTPVPCRSSGLRST
jgi:hypothetical protein